MQCAPNPSVSELNWPVLVISTIYTRKEALDLLVFPRKLHKMTLMCCLYNDMYLSRLKNFREIFASEKKRDFLGDRYEIFKFFALKYEDFIDFVFPLLNI